MSNPVAEQNTTAIKLLWSQRVWKAGKHNAFTDLCYFNQRYYLVFRQASTHHSTDGVLRIMSSVQGKKWRTLAVLRNPAADLRDGKLSVTPCAKLQLLAAAAFHDKTNQAYQSYLWFSADGKNWSEPQAVGEADYWLWRLSWLRNLAYAVAYKCGPDRHIRLYQQNTAGQFEVVAPRIYSDGYANEAALLFDHKDTAWCLLRKDPDHGQLGYAFAPYHHWNWLDIGCRIGGPQAIFAPSGQMLAVVRLYDTKVRTSLVGINQDTGLLTELLTLPSAGDCSYAGMVLRQNSLLISYYSSHQGHCSIYTALVQLAEK
ncbi:exo-alpha-sialidase [Rheinheimera sediminis]|uniref:exo-alpha-sialidase n=1 Tax=Rheinheimera sp. YQF-1 TaxID=2499626 RepID=UPI000FDC6105|nr:exo-alpha-sialidase [Rheinheimera sp. YQF-1]RVT44426.1 exo-alpha-sialidase [Rheinheimera sp. YQF-1]